MQQYDGGRGARTAGLPQVTLQRMRTGKRVLDFNPMTHLIVTYQEILFFDGPVGHWKWLLLVGGLSMLLFLAGYWLFDRLRDSFAEAV